MVRNNRLKIKQDGLVVNADIKTQKLEEKNIESQPEIVRRDPNRLEVTRELYDKATGELLEDGYGYRWVNEEGDEVPEDEVQYYQIVGGEEREVSRQEPTLGRGRTLKPVSWTSLGEIGEFLVTRTYEVWSENEEDISQLYELADFVRVRAQAPVVSVVLKRSILESWGIVTPQFYDDEFSLIMRVTRKRVEPQHHMPVLPEEVEGFDEEEQRSGIEQESPFGR